MDLNEFFLFGSDFSSVPVCASNSDIDFGTFNEIAKGDYKHVNLPVLFKQTSGNKWTDILNPASVSLYIVSTKFKELLQKVELTGWKSFEINLLDKNGIKVEGYVGFSIIGKCGPIDYSKSVVYEKQLVPNGTWNKYYKGLHIGLNNWDGSDFFMPEGTLFIVVTKRVKELIESAKISNIMFENLSEYEISEFAIK